MGEFSFLTAFNLFVNYAADGNETTVECDSEVNHYRFYQFSLIPAIILTLLMASTKSRRKMLLNFLDGRPGLVFPMDTLTRSSRISYCCAFGATGFLVYQILWNQKTAVEYNGPIALKTFIAIISMFIYGMVFFPVFTSLALGTAFSYFLGSLYVWMFFIIEIYKATECEFTATGRVLILTRALPSLLCLGYLSISMPVKFCIAVFMKKKYFTPSLGEDPYRETVEQIKKSYQGKHVRNLLRKPEVVKPPEGMGNIIKALVVNKLCSCVYHSESGFRYPSRLISVMFVAACVVYVITVETLVSAVKILDDVLEELEKLTSLTMDSEAEDDGTALVYLAVFYVTYILKVSLIVSVSVSCLITLLTILHMLTSFRTNLFAMYRGDYSHIPPPSQKSAISLCTGSIKYAGFQVAYIVWAYVITCVILAIICIILATLITLLMFGITDWLVNKVLQIWPGFVIGLGLFAVQFILAKFVFLQDRGQHLRLDNRRFYFIFVYFMFFYNIFLGLVSCLLRIIKAIGVGTVFLARLDNSTLPRKFEFFDPGFNAYQGYIHLEAAHTHPVVNVFIRLLVALADVRKKDDFGLKEIEMSPLKVAIDFENGKESTVPRSLNVSARFNWYLAYTLLHNPAVRIYRKGFIQSMRKAIKEGVKVPISDLPVTDFDLVKAQEERDRQREASKMSHDVSHGFATAFGKGSAREEKAKSKRARKYNWFRKWKKRSASVTLTSVEIASENSSLGNDDQKSYFKNNDLEV